MNIRAFNKGDLKTLARWLEQDHIRKYWGDPGDWTREVSQNLTAGWVQYFLVENNQPIGFLQYYETDRAPQGEWSDEPIGTVGIDYLIGEKQYLGKGYGTKIVKLFVDLIRSTHQYDYIIADPVTENTASVKVLENCGFRQKSNGLYVFNLNNTGIKIYRAHKRDVGMITGLFRNTILTINAKDYPADQIEDWASWWSDLEKWREKIEDQYFIKALIGDDMVGFGSLAKDGYLDFMFTRQDYQRHGVAANLLKKIERKARQQGNEMIYSDVSLTAKGFFERNGYVVEKQQLKKSRYKSLVNFRMVKRGQGMPCPYHIRLNI